MRRREEIPAGPSRPPSRREVLLLLAAWPLVGCDAKSPAGTASVRVVRDALGVGVSLPTEVRRVVTTVPGLTQTVLSLDGPARLAGVSDQDAAADVPPDAVRLPVWPTIPAERVAALAPDLLLVDSTLSNQDLPALRRRFPATFACDSTSLDGLARTFEAVGEALGRREAAARLLGELATARGRARAPGRPTVLLLTWADPPMALGPGSLLDDLVRSVGAQNVAFDLPGPSRPLSSEVVRARAPQWILLTGGTFPDSLRAAWASVPAVRDGRVVDASADDLVRAGPGTARALLRLAALLSPAGSSGPR